MMAFLLLLMTMAFRLPEPAQASATTSGAPAVAARGDEAQAVKARVTAYWRLRQAKDLAGMYDFYAEAYRAAHSKSEFTGLTRLVRVEILSFEVAKVTLDGGKATVTMRYRCRAAPLPEPFDAEGTENWVRERATWFRQDEPLLLPFPQK